MATCSTCFNASDQPLVVTQALRLVLVGLVIGIILGLVGSRLLGSLLYGVDADPLVFGLTPVVPRRQTGSRGAVSMYGCFWPAANALRSSEVLVRLASSTKVSGYNRISSSFSSGVAAVLHQRQQQLKGLRRQRHGPPVTQQHTLRYIHRERPELV